MLLVASFLAGLVFRLPSEVSGAAMGSTEMVLTTTYTDYEDTWTTSSGRPTTPFFRRRVCNQNVPGGGSCHCVSCYHEHIQDGLHCCLHQYYSGAANHEGAAAIFTPDYTTDGFLAVESEFKRTVANALNDYCHEKLSECSLNEKSSPYNATDVVVLLLEYNFETLTLQIVFTAMSPIEQGVKTHIEPISGVRPSILISSFEEYTVGWESASLQIWSIEKQTLTSFVLVLVLTIAGALGLGLLLVCLAAIIACAA